MVPDMAAGARRHGEPLFPPEHVPTDEPQWWQLAYDAAGDLIGLVVPKRGGAGGGSIHWIGVVPEQRGRGYVDDLIARGLEILAAAGIERVHAATHVLNTPMQAAFPRMGFRQTETRWWYEFDLAQLREPASGTGPGQAVAR
jgi:RimJ/RimL family protein N-acetyltransferase